MRVSFQQVTSADTFRRRAQKNEPAPRGPWASSKPALGSGRRSLVLFYTLTPRLSGNQCDEDRGMNLRGMRSHEQDRDRPEFSAS